MIRAKIWVPRPPGERIAWYGEDKVHVFGNHRTIIDVTDAPELNEAPKGFRHQHLIALSTDFVAWLAVTPWPEVGEVVFTPQRGRPILIEDARPSGVSFACSSPMQSSAWLSIKRGVKLKPLPKSESAEIAASSA